MRLRNRTDDREPEAPSGPQAGATAGAGGRERWRAADRLAAAADDAIDRALARDSQRFLEANRQEGGQ